MPTGHSSQPDQTTQAVAAAIRAQMGFKDVSQADLARKTGLSQPTLSRLLKAQRVIDLKQLIDICNVLGVSHVALLEQAERSIHGNGLAPVTQLRPKVSEDAPSVVERAAARRGKGNKKDDSLGDD